MCKKEQAFPRITSLSERERERERKSLMSNSQKRVQKKAWQKREQEKEIKRKQDEKKQYQCWKYYTRNQKEVAKRISAGDYEIINGQGWGFLDRFFHFLAVVGILVLLEIEGAKFQRKMYALSQLLLTYQSKILLGIDSMNGVPDILFKDIGLLQLLGFTAKQIKGEGNERWKGQGSEQPKRGPMHESTLADAIEKFSADEIEYLLNKSVQVLSSHGFIRGKVYALDATDLETTSKYKGRGSVTRTKKVVNRKGEIVQIKVTVYGWKLLVLMDLESRIIVAAKVVKIQEHESQFTIELLQQAEKNIGQGKIKVLVMDRGFLDGVTLWKIKHELAIDFVVPAKGNMAVTKDAQSFRSRFANGQEIFRAQKVIVEKRRKKKTESEAKITEKQTIAVGIKGLLSYDQYGDQQHQEKIQRKDFSANPINAVMIECWQGKKYADGKETVFLTSLPVASPLAVMDYYDDRSLIENTGFRELKQGWLLTSYPKKTEDAVRNHVLLTSLTFSLCNCFRTDEGQKLTQQGIRRFRRQHADAIHKVVVFAGDYYAIFDLEELMTILGKPPKFCFRTDPERTKRTYDLP